MAFAGAERVVEAMADALADAVAVVQPSTIMHLNLMGMLHFTNGSADAGSTVYLIGQTATGATVGKLHRRRELHQLLPPAGAQAVFDLRRSTAASVMARDTVADFMGRFRAYECDDVEHVAFECTLETEQDGVCYSWTTKAVRPAACVGNTAQQQAMLAAHHEEMCTALAAGIRELVGMYISIQNCKGIRFE